MGIRGFVAGLALIAASYLPSLQAQDTRVLDLATRYQEVKKDLEVSRTREDSQNPPFIKDYVSSGFRFPKGEFDIFLGKKEPKARVKEDERSDKNAKELLRKYRDNVATTILMDFDEGRKHVGSGIFVSKDSFFTTYHTSKDFRNGKFYVLFFDGSIPCLAEAERVAWSEGNEIALCHSGLTNRNAIQIPLAKNNPKKGESVYTFLREFPKDIGASIEVKGKIETDVVGGLEVSLNSDGKDIGHLRVKDVLDICSTGFKVDTEDYINLFDGKGGLTRCFNQQRVVLKGNSGNSGSPVFYFESGSLKLSGMLTSAINDSVNIGHASSARAIRELVERYMREKY